MSNQSNNTQQKYNYPVTSRQIDSNKHPDDRQSNNRQEMTAKILDKIQSMPQSAGGAVRKVGRYGRGGLTINKTTGVIIWMIGAWLTVQFLVQLGVSESYATVIGIGLQLALTRAETPLWRGEGIPKMSLGAVIVDIAINSSGAWPFIKNIGGTDFWTMIREVAEQPTLDPSTATILSLSLGAGAFTAASAEYFWNLE